MNMKVCRSGTLIFSSFRISKRNKNITSQLGKLRIRVLRMQTEINLVFLTRFNIHSDNNSRSKTSSRFSKTISLLLCTISTTLTKNQHSPRTFYRRCSKIQSSKKLFLSKSSLKTTLQIKTHHFSLMPNLKSQIKFHFPKIILILMSIKT